MSLVDYEASDDGEPAAPSWQCLHSGCSVRVIRRRYPTGNGVVLYCARHRPRCAHVGCYRSVLVTAHKGCRAADPGRESMCPVHGGWGRCAKVTCTRIAKKGGFCADHGGGVPTCVICRARRARVRKCCNECIHEIVANRLSNVIAPPREWAWPQLGSWLMGAGAPRELLDLLSGYTGKQFASADLSAIVPHAMPLDPVVVLQTRFIAQYAPLLE